MTEFELFILSDVTLNEVVQRIRDDQWDLEVPDYVTPRGGTLREIINYHAYDDAFVPDTLAGKTIDEVGDKYAGDLLGDDPKAAFAAIVGKSVEAVKALDDPERTVHLTYGDFSAREGLKHQTSFRVFRVFTLSKFLGQDTTMPEALIDGTNECLSPEVEDWRAVGIFGPALEVAPEASKQDKLLALFGVDPR